MNAHTYTRSLEAVSSRNMQMSASAVFCCLMQFKIRLKGQVRYGCSGPLTASRSRRSEPANQTRKCSRGPGEWDGRHRRGPVVGGVGPRSCGLSPLHPFGDTVVPIATVFLIRSVLWSLFGPAGRTFSGRLPPAALWPDSGFPPPGTHEPGLQPQENRNHAFLEGQIQGVLSPRKCAPASR